jgi:hypothetical protein
LDGGAAGACPFYYADGWWKAGDPATHSNEPEEWFGYWGYSDINDTMGYPRPVWYAITEYNQGIVTSPRNGEIYSNTVPVEAFLTDNVKRVKVIYDDKIVLDKPEISAHYFADNIVFTDDTLVDREIVMEFYDGAGKLIKYETIIILTSDKSINMPTIAISVAPSDLAKSKICKASIELTNNSPFTLGKEARYVFSHHIGWNAGPQSVVTIDPQKRQQKFSTSYSIPDDCHVLSVSTGIDIRFGKFVKTIHSEQILYRGNWADAIRIK